MAYGKGKNVDNPTFPNEREFKSSHGRGNIESNHGSAFGVPVSGSNVMDERLKGKYKGGSGKGGK